MTSRLCVNIFNQAITEYHISDNIDQPMKNGYLRETVEYLLYAKCWIDNVQWHMEDLIRNPGIIPAEALKLKQRIDKSNQDRTDVVELIDDFFLQKFKDVELSKHARLNTESVAWAIDRLSILSLKIFHMEEQILRDTSDEHKNGCRLKLQVLQEQNIDLSQSLDELINEIGLGRTIIKVYRQMKMYNDPSLNPVLYGKLTKPAGPV